LAVLTAATLMLAGCKVQAEPTGSTTANPHVTATGSAKTASQELDKLEIGKPASMKGYSREKFPHWKSTGKNCDVRDSVLKRDGSKVKLSGCNVVAGSWKSIYDDKTLTSPTQVDIDHVVPLANAWRSGAASWTTDKGDQDPSTWKPPATDNWCHYAESWIAVKTHWKLTVTTAEKSALADMLEKC
jgi:hypothetical protein